MKIQSCEIYKGRKLIGVLPCKYFEKTDLHDEYFLLANRYPIKPGYTLIINKKEKFYVTDVRLHSYKESHINVFFETVAQHKEKFFKFWIPVIISIVALFRPEITKLIDYIVEFINKT